jgi:hypothetical protein
MPARKTRRTWLALAAGALVLIVLVNLETVGLSAAIVMAERRPALLRDARWNDPMSAQKFRSRFGRGAPEADLVTWLQSNGFSVDRPHGQAIRTIESLPCNEVARIKWVRRANGTIDGASAILSEAGCL